jgi:DNA repair protein RadC
VTKQQSRLRRFYLSQQPREKAAERGLEALTNRELLALTIGSGQAKHHVSQIAARIEKILTEPLNQLTNHQQLSQKLQQVPGVGSITAQKILASLELWRRLSKPNPILTIDQPSKLYALSKDIHHKQQEYCLVFYCNGRGELIQRHIVAIGGLNVNFLEPRDIFAPALQLRAASLIVVHNHPSGNPEPSADDVLLTERLLELAELLGFTLLDHLIVSRTGYISLRESHQELFLR